MAVFELVLRGLGHGPCGLQRFCGAVGKENGQGPRSVPTKKEVKKTDCIGRIKQDCAGRGAVEGN